MSELTKITLSVNWEAKELKPVCNSTDRIEDILNHIKKSLLEKYDLKVTLENMIVIYNNEKIEWTTETIVGEKEIIIELQNINETNNEIIKKNLEDEMQNKYNDGYEFEFVPKLFKRKGEIFECDETTLVGKDPIDIICDIKYKKMKLNI
jgi:hypothetical protein